MSSSSGLPPLNVAREEAAARLLALATNGRAIAGRDLRTARDLEDARNAASRWRRHVGDLLRYLFEGDRVLQAVTAAWGAAGVRLPRAPEAVAAMLRADMRERSDDLESLIARLDLYPEPAEARNVVALDQPASNGVLAEVLHLCERFHVVARQLRRRYADRATLHVRDEYDVQDLMYGLLRLHFDDIRQEELKKCDAAKPARLSFVVPSSGLVVQTRMARPGAGAGALEAELSDDIAHCQRRPEYRTLVCYAYDPDGEIVNPRGIERDLEDRVVPPLVRVLIRP